MRSPREWAAISRAADLSGRINETMSFLSPLDIGRVNILAQYRQQLRKRTDAAPQLLLHRGHQHNTDPKPFISRKTAQQLRKLSTLVSCLSNIRHIGSPNNPAGIGCPTLRGLARHDTRRTTRRCIVQELRTPRVPSGLESSFLCIAV